MNGWIIKYGFIGAGRGAGVNYTLKTVYVDIDILFEKYLDKAWTVSLKQGVNPLPEDIFKSYSEWEAFVLEHEWQHVRNPRVGEWTPQYENSINKAALVALGY